ncbi:HVO_2142 family zinc finger protein [Salinigranum sp. GCM10025319]|uniref:HVO_2142 family zinc finger protein n=1 Tax=Salinigranum sp. GCM10025319 TaxID=3252687 RepID=UPI00360C2FA8
MATTNRPPSIPEEHCPSCGTELLFSGTQPAGLAQFFCETCHYRHDRFVGASADTAGETRGQTGAD